jgi:hypothetical protein
VTSGLVGDIGGYEHISITDKTIAGDAIFT